MFYAGGGITEAGLKIKNVTQGFIRQKTIEGPTKMVLYPHSLRAIMTYFTSPNSAFPQTSSVSQLSAGAHAIPNVTIGPGDHVPLRLSAGQSNDLNRENRSWDTFDYIDSPEGPNGLWPDNNTLSSSRDTSFLKEYLKTIWPQLDGQLLLNHYRSTQHIRDHQTQAINLYYTSPGIAIIGPLINSYRGEEAYANIAGYARMDSKDLETIRYTLPNGLSQNWATLGTTVVLPGASGYKRNLTSVQGVTRSGVTTISSTQEVIPSSEVAAPPLNLGLNPASGVRPFVINIIESVRRPLEPRDIFWLQPGQVIRNCTCQLFEYDFS